MDLDGSVRLAPLTGTNEAAAGDELYFKSFRLPVDGVSNGLITLEDVSTLQAANRLRRGETDLRIRPRVSPAALGHI